MPFPGVILQWAADVLEPGVRRLGLVGLRGCVCLRNVCSGSGDPGPGLLAPESSGPHVLVKVWLLWLRVIFRPEMAGGHLGINPRGLAA